MSFSWKIKPRSRVVYLLCELTTSTSLKVAITFTLWWKQLSTYVFTTYVPMRCTMVVLISFLEPQIFHFNAFVGCVLPSRSTYLWSPHRTERLPRAKCELLYIFVTFIWQLLNKFHLITHCIAKLHIYIEDS